MIRIRKRAVAFAAGELFPCGPEVAVPERGFGYLLDLLGTNGANVMLVRKAGNPESRVVPSRAISIAR